MQRNVGSLDRTVRVVVGIAVLSLAFIGPATAWAYLGLIPIATGFFGYCPLYSLLGISTAPRKPAHA